MDERTVTATPDHIADLAALRTESAAVHDRTIALRRRLHRRPEVGLVLPETRAAVLEEIADLGLEVRTSPSTSAVVAELAGGLPGPTVILRGDMDALPLQERTGLDFASELTGAMHACGHDTHVAMLAGAARVLAARRASLPGRVLFFFQPGEEGQGGARIALDEGLLDVADGTVAGAFALHITTAQPSGTIALRPGPLMAAADTFEVTVRGRGGHASAPAMANDPIPAACAMVTALQTALTRRVNALDPAVLSVTHVAAGTTNNVIPATAWFEGTIRTLDEDVRTAVHAQLRRVVAGVAEAHEVTAEAVVAPGYPVTVNDADFAERVLAVAAELLGPDHAVVMDEPLMGAEDFSYVLRRYPGTMAFLGACPPDQVPGEGPWNHSDLVVFDESALDAGVAMHAAVALDALATRPR